MDRDLFRDHDVRNRICEGDFSGAEPVCNDECFIQGDHAVGGIDRRAFGGDGQVVFQIGQAVQRAGMDRGPHGDIFFCCAVIAIAVEFEISVPCGKNFIGDTVFESGVSKTARIEHQFDTVPLQ